MRAKADILALGARYRIEAPHTKHVARLALNLFDGFMPVDGLEAADRDILFAAANLHDIAYETDAQNHVVKAADILEDNRIDAFSKDEWLMVVGIVLLHKRDWRSMLDHDVFRSVGDRKVQRIKRLAAMLRIADGLDHGHIQDTKIIYCKPGRTEDKIGVHCGWYAGNIPWAESKADLWEAVFKRSFGVEGEVEQHKTRFKRVVDKSDSAVSGMRRIFYSQWCIMRDNVPGMLEGLDPECLHDYRVAMRRFRAALRMFEPPLAGTAAKEIDAALKKLSDQLGPLRDAHVALQFVTALDSEMAVEPNVLDVLEREAATASRTLCRILKTESFVKLEQQVLRFLRVELPDLERRGDGEALLGCLKKSLDNQLKRIMRQNVDGLRNADSGEVHKVRKICRRGRYYAEFSEPVLGRKTREATKQLKKIAGGLGNAHDARLLAARFDNQAFVEAVQRLEDEAWERFGKGWRKLGKI